MNQLTINFSYQLSPHPFQQPIQLIQLLIVPLQSG